MLATNSGTDFKIEEYKQQIQHNIFCPPVEGQSKVARKDGASQKDGC